MRRLPLVHGDPMHANQCFFKKVPSDQPVDLPAGSGIRSLPDMEHHGPVGGQPVQLPPPVLFKSHRMQVMTALENRDQLVVGDHLPIPGQRESRRQPRPMIDDGRESI